MPPATGASTRRTSSPGRVVLAAATCLGLWFGLTAPDVSPILPSPAAQQTAVDDGGPANGRGGRR